MIANERQYRITNAQLDKLTASLKVFDFGKAVKRTGSRVLAKAEHDALESQVEELAEQIREYETLKSGAVNVLKAASLEELPLILIKARIAKGLSQLALAKKIGLKEQQVQRYEAENYASASLRRLAEVARALRLEVREIAELNPSPKKTVSDDFDWRGFPIQEMYRRGWFEDFFSGSLDDALNNCEEIVSLFLSGVFGEPVPALLRQHVRAGSTMNEYALLAWQCRVLSLAQEQPPANPFAPEDINEEWLQELVHNSRYKDGPVRARKHLEAAGIRLVIEPHLQHTYLDGAALLLPDGKPVIGLTLRYDRLDNFWFVSAHEVVHVVRHLRKGETEVFFDDLDDDLTTEPDKLEREADQLAGDILIPVKTWETALARYVRSEESIRDLAKRLGISPALVAGRIRKEAANYTILTNMVGQGEVRKHFPEVTYGY